jgi:hypothetical protein
LRKTKVRVVGDPGLVAKITQVIQAHFVLCKPARKFDRPVGRDTAHSKAPGCTIYLDIKEEKQLITLVLSDFPEDESPKIFDRFLGYSRFVQRLHPKLEFDLRMGPFYSTVEASA